MNQKQYLAALKKSLKGIDSQNRDNILLEIEGHISELSTQESIEERFGTPVELAKQYLKDETISPTVGKKVMGFSKKIFLTIGILITLVVLALGLYAWFYSQDAFNYADTTAKELNINEANWNSVEWNTNIIIDIDQARAVIYWHDQPSLHWNCGEKQDLNPVPDKTLMIRHDQCLIFLPKQDVEISAKQADLVFIKPQASASIKLNQTKLRIAEKGVSYRFEIDATRSHIGSFMSKEDAPITITIKATESKIEAYEY